MASLQILRLADAPEHLDTIAAWNYAEWGKKSGSSLRDSMDWFQSMIGAPSEECVLATRGDDVIGMASLVDHDLDERPDLLHWLASVYVPPAFRKTGIASALIEAVEREAALRDIACMYLYTNTAEQLYTRLGWEVSERFQRGPEGFTIMRKDPRG
ncbi:GNAT family N-acetyltransferase [Nisaea nitritireducens]|uniref:GNAT family N-acetyltransferase n=1 Tax=Nisaea nitritireducens TaxID=568392 RepID=UPI001867F3B3|nr:GNAT family N-acetyltransferase [Nisaea nitritireducens]